MLERSFRRLPFFIAEEMTMPVHDWTRVIADIFHDFHQSRVPKIASVLNDGLLPPKYYALAEQVAAGSHPDVVALESRLAEDQIGGGSCNGGALAVLDHPPKVQYTEELERETYARSADRVAVYHATGDRVVAFIEIVSPGNKHTAYETEQFAKKLMEALNSGIHLLVIDVHPPGPHDPRGMHAAFWQQRSSEAHDVTAEQPLGLSAYRGDVAPSAYFQPVAVGEPLPDMPVFLTPDHYVNVPLEATYMEAWRGVPNRWKQVIEAEGEGSSA
jgi:hypothetical protein